MNNANVHDVLHIYLLLLAKRMCLFNAITGRGSTGGLGWGEEKVGEEEREREYVKISLRYTGFHKIKCKIILNSIEVIADYFAK